MKKTPEEKARLNAFYGAQGLPFSNTGHSLTGVSEPLYYNDSIHIIYDACRSCYAIKDNNKSYDEIKTYIGKRVQAGHDSIVEHSNIIIAVHGTSDDYLPDLLRLTTNRRNLCKYLKVSSNAADPNRNTNTFDTIFQGSIRGFKHLLINFPWNEEDNCFVEHIRRQLYQCTVKELWSNVSPEIMDPTQFIDNIAINQLDLDPELDEDDEKELRDQAGIDIEKPFTISYKNNDKFEIVNIDNAATVSYLVPHGLLDSEGLRECCTITILFKNMSRTATHQLVRHRNAITQESQRYVNYDNAGFTVPPVAKYLPKEDMFEIDLYGIKKKCSLESLGTELCKIYGQLRKQGIKKEDARAYLPSNVQCHAIYMTFTFSSLLKFFELRCEPHAQAEIREYAWELLHTLLRLQECKAKGYTEEFAADQGIDLTSPFWIPGLKEFYNSVLVKYDDDAEVIATSENSVE